MFSAGQKFRTAAEAQQEGEAVAGPTLIDHVRSVHPRIADRSFELNAWDVQFTFSGAYAELDSASEPECSCTPLPVPEMPNEPEIPEGRTDDEKRVAWETYYRLAMNAGRLNKSTRIARFPSSRPT